MKRLALLSAIILVPFFAIAQSASIDRLIDKYGGENALIAITGDINLESISSLTSGMDLPAMENLEGLDK